MGVIQDLLSQHSLESIILLVLMVAFSMKGIIDLRNFFASHFEQRVKDRTKLDEQNKQLAQQVELLMKSQENLTAEVKDLHQRLDTIERTISRIMERNQEQARSWIIDKHHQYCYNEQKITDQELEAIERRYLYYKSEGGNSYIDTLMNDIRALPRVN